VFGLDDTDVIQFGVEASLDDPLNIMLGCDCEELMRPLSLR